MMEIKIGYRVYTRNALNNIYVIQLELRICIYIPDMLFNLYLNPECLTNLKKMKLALSSHFSFMFKCNS